MTRIEGSFLFTEEERLRLRFLCCCPELAPILAESLAQAFVAEDRVAAELSSSVNRESLAISRELESRESLAEREEIDSVFA